MNLLSEKTLVMVVGPTSIGKSSLMNEVAKLSSDFARVSGFTTRQPRPDDEPGLYRYVSESEAQVIIASDDLIQYAVNPANNRLYGTTAIDYPGRFNLQDTLSSAVDFYKTVPFARHVTISLTTDADTWRQWLISRYPDAGIERTNRLKEAIASIEWSLRQTTGHCWIVNRKGELPLAARHLIQIATTDVQPEPTPPEATKLLEAAQTLLSYE